MTETATPAAPAAVDWDALIAAATTEDKSVAAKRAVVPVPPPVLALVKNAREKGQRINLPYVAATYSELCDVFYSAGDMLEPKASVSIARTKVVDGKVVVLKARDTDEGVTGVRISIGDRRGQKDKPADKPAEAKADA